MKKFSFFVNLKKAFIISSCLLFFIFVTPQTGSAVTPSLPPDPKAYTSGETLNPFVQAFAILLNFAFGKGNAPVPTSSNPTGSVSNPAQQQKAEGFGLGELVYFPQCGPEFGNTSLPGGCSLCKAGCGPTTVAMILSSYIDKTFTPAKVVELYQERGLMLGCLGSKLTDAKAILEANGMLTTNNLFYPKVTAQDTNLLNDLKNYIKKGRWTMFALADFDYPDPSCTKCHFFWIIDIDESNNIWAYDPYYGMLQIPYNENSYPNVRYKMMFGVKKK